LIIVIFSNILRSKLSFSDISTLQNKYITYTTYDNHENVIIKIL